MEELERNKIIQPSESPWNAPLLVVPKKPHVKENKQYWVSINFHCLNQLTTGDAYPISRINEILDQLGRFWYFSTFDLAGGYHEIPIKPEDREKTGVSTDIGHFEFFKRQVYV